MPYGSSSVVLCRPYRPPHAAVGLARDAQFEQTHHESTVQLSGVSRQGLTRAQPTSASRPIHAAQHPPGRQCGRCMHHESSDLVAIVEHKAVSHRHNGPHERAAHDGKGKLRAAGGAGRGGR